MRAWMWAGLMAAAVGCSSGTTKDDTDASGDTDLVVVDTDHQVHDTDDTDIQVPSCPLPADLGEITLVSSDASVASNGTSLAMVLNDQTPPDVLRIELYGSTPTFAEQPVPGVYALSGADLNYATCGVCLLLLLDVEEDGPAEFYFPTSGTVTLTETTTGIRGSLSDVVFARVTVDPSTFETTVLDACTSTLDALDFGADFPL